MACRVPRGLSAGAVTASARRIVLLAFGSVACHGAFVDLGSSGDELSGAGANGGPENGGGGSEIWRVSAQLVIAPADGFQLANPSLTADGRQLYLSVQRRGADPEPYATTVWHAIWNGDRFDSARELSLPFDDPFGVAGPAISADGTELWLSRLGDAGDAEIWRSSGLGDDWGPAERVAELCSAFDDVARPASLGGTLMPLSSKRHGGVLHQIYFASRAANEATWGEPNQDHLASVNSPNYLSADGFLSADGLSLYFASTRDGPDADLYVTRRPSVDADFGEPRALAELNTPYEERMPWVSADEQTIYFASNRPNAFEQYAIYVATRSAP